MVMVDSYTTILIDQLNKDIEQFPQVHSITPDMHITHKGVSRLVMIDRYSFKDTEKKTLKPGDFVVLTIKEDPKFPARGLGYIQSIDWNANKAEVLIEEEYRNVLDDPKEQETGIIVRSLDVIEKPLEIFMNKLRNEMQQAYRLLNKQKKNAMNGSKNFTSN